MHEPPAEPEPAVEVARPRRRAAARRAPPAVEEPAEVEQVPAQASTAHALAEAPGAPAVDDATPAAPEPEPQREVPRPKKKTKRAAAPAAPIAQSSLFDDSPSQPAGAEDLAELVLPAPAAAKAGAEPAGLSDLLFEAGSLILEQNRVAVSMLQRRFELDFDAATAVLDQLQALGLIGPYLGGKTRAILMTREEWMAFAHGV